VPSLVLTAAELSTVPLSNTAVQPQGLDITPSGVLIVTCSATHGLYAVEPETGEALLLAGDGTRGCANGSALKASFSAPIGVVVVDSERCAYLCDLGNNVIRCVSLPPNLFELPKS
jgi:hypothetical protein